MRKRNLLLAIIMLPLSAVAFVYAVYHYQSAITRGVADGLGVQPLGGGVEGGTNPRNAITHSYWQASWTFYARQIIGDNAARHTMTFAGYLVDPPGINTDRDSVKDRWNNAQGRACGLTAHSHDEVIDCLKQAMRDKKLIMTVHDPRLDKME